MQEFLRFFVFLRKKRRRKEKRRLFGDRSERVLWLFDELSTPFYRSVGGRREEYRQMYFRSVGGRRGCGIEG